MNILVLFRRKLQPLVMKPATEQVAAIVAEAVASQRSLLIVGTGKREIDHGRAS